MELKLNQFEIESALVEYIGSQGISTHEKQIEVNMVAGRGANGFSAEIVIRQLPDTPEVEGNTGIAALDKDVNPTDPADDTTLFAENA